MNVKLFKDFTSPLYTPIDMDMGMDFIRTEAVDMSKKVSDKILSFNFKANTVNKLVLEGDPDAHAFVLNSINPGYHFVDITTNRNNIEIVELEDEWFIVRVHGTFPVSLQYRKCPTFKCDQLDGLFALLTDIGV